MERSACVHPVVGLSHGSQPSPSHGPSYSESFKNSLDKTMTKPLASHCRKIQCKILLGEMNRPKREVKMNYNPRFRHGQKPLISQCSIQNRVVVTALHPPIRTIIGFDHKFHTLIESCQRPSGLFAWAPSSRQVQVSKQAPNH